MATIRLTFYCSFKEKHDFSHKETKKHKDIICILIPIPNIHTSFTRSHSP